MNSQTALNYIRNNWKLFFNILVPHNAGSGAKLKQMAKQKGLHKILGTVGDATYSKTKDGYQVQEKSGISKSTFETSGNLELTRQNASEFGRAGKAAKLLRLSMGDNWKRASDPRAFSRLLQEMMRVLKTDPIHLRGQRTVAAGEIGLLEGFEFNKFAGLSTVFPVTYSATIDRLSGQLTVSVPSFIPIEKLPVPEGTSHFMIVSTGSEIDFDNNSFINSESNSAMLPWDQTDTAAITLESEVTPNSDSPLFLFVGIQFFQHVNGVYNRMKNVAFNALSLVKVNEA